eukprot:13343852-Alexandrium_andersonii.AAC.1
MSTSAAPTPGNLLGSTAAATRVLAATGLCVVDRANARTAPPPLVDFEACEASPSSVAGPPRATG